MAITAEEKEALKQKYLAERDKRLRDEGNAQYIEVKGQLSHYLDDPYVPVAERDAKTDHVAFAFIGGGFAGLVTGAKLVDQGITDVRIIEKGGDFGGTWYWNRYPGAMCDTAAFVYMPLLEETGHMPTEKYAHGPEILEHCQRIGKQWGLYENALFHTQVRELAWDDDRQVWRIRTDRGDDFTAQFVGLGTGPLHVPKLPGIQGIESFKGHSFHTSRWDYDYTGGDAKGGLMTGLKDKRVALIGTGATAVQCVPHLAKACETLYVCQRTPSSVDVRANHPIDPDWFEDMATPGWQQRYYDNFVENQQGGFATEDLIQDGWTDLSRRIREKIMTLPKEERRDPLKMLAAYEDADFEKMNQIRARVDEVVGDSGTAEKLKAWYRQLCKRPCFHDEYLQAFNEPSTTLLDTDGEGVQAITERGVIVQGKEYEVDCIIYGSGFEVGTGIARRAGFEIVGRGGQSLTDYWADGMLSLHGLHIHGFPNLFMQTPTQAAMLISNVPHNIVDHAKTIAQVVRHAQDVGARTVEPEAEAVDEWVELLKTGGGRMRGAPDCTPGYYNNEGKAPPRSAQNNLGYPEGAASFFRYIAKWRENEDYRGLIFE